MTCSLFIEEIKDVLTRYYTLKEANEDLQITSTKVPLVFCISSVVSSFIVVYC